MARQAKVLVARDLALRAAVQLRLQSFDLGTKKRLVCRAVEQLLTERYRAGRALLLTIVLNETQDFVAEVSAVTKGTINKDLTYAKRRLVTILKELIDVA